MHKYEELENRWKRYSMKRNLRLYFLPSLLVGGGFLLYYLFFLAIHSNDAPSEHLPVAAIPQEKTALVSKTETKQDSEEIKTAAVDTKEPPATAPASKPEMSAPKAVAKPASSPSVDSSTPETTTAQPQQNTRPVESQPIESLVSPGDPVCYTINVPVLNIREQPYIGATILGKYRQDDVVCEFERQKGWIRGEFGWVYANNLVSIDTNAPAPKTNPSGNDRANVSLNDIIEESAASSLSIVKKEITEDEKIALLLERFNANEHAATAMELSQLYFDNKNYEQSRAWALKANALDSQDATTWLMFAKSSYKMGQKKEAIKALETLLLQKPDINAAKELLNLYKKGLM